EHDGAHPHRERYPCRLDLRRRGVGGQLPQPRKSLTLRGQAPFPMILFHDLSASTDEQVHDWLEAIANNLRPGDRDELRATNPLLTIGDPDPMLVLTMSVMNSEDAWIITDDGEPICVFGAGPSGDGSGIVW